MNLWSEGSARESDCCSCAQTFCKNVVSRVLEGEIDYPLCINCTCSCWAVPRVRVGFASEHRESRVRFGRGVGVR